MFENNGYILLSRKMFNSDFWHAEKFSRAQAWVDMIFLAYNKESEIRVRGIAVPIERGQVVVPLSYLERRWRWSKNKIQRFLGDLTRYGYITQIKGRPVTVIVINKYNDYQPYSDSQDLVESSATAKNHHNSERQEII